MSDPLSRGISPRQEQNLLDGADPLTIIEPTDLHAIPWEKPKLDSPANRRAAYWDALIDHEGEAILLPPELLEYVSTHPCNTREECDHIEMTLDQYYLLDGSGHGAAWDARHRCARLVKL